ncbi:MAG: hypothetical protein PWQ25_151 [Deferribacteres bacterium]|nr:hypothetical protein [Deferribacteraceae bacterium]MDK2791288.1 hypothetical protein [Deferribacteres bacterium]
MGRYLQILLVVAILAIVFLFKKDGKLPTPKIERNSLYMKNMNLKENIGDKGYYSVRAAEAYVYDNFKKIEMKKCYVVYNEKGNNTNIVSERCKIIVDEKLEMFDNISGDFNEYRFEGGENSNLIYFFDNNTGFVSGGLQISTNTSKLYSDNVFFDKKKRIVQFEGSVRVDYEN